MVNWKEIAWTEDTAGDMAKGVKESNFREAPQ